MNFRQSIGLLILCLFMGCGVLKKDKTQVTNSSVDKTAIPELPTEYDTPNLVLIDTFVTPPPKMPLEYMSIEEQAMIDEINLLRADPNSYIQYVDAYIQNVMDDPNWDFNSRQAERIAADELVRTLNNLNPLELLTPSEALYKAAKKHGKDMKENKFISHIGSDNSTPELRIQDSTTLVGSENLAAGGRSVRESIMMLLVDANDRANRSHRKTILNPSWKEVACYYAGTVDEVPGTWVQLFGYEDPEDPIRNKPMRSSKEETPVGVPADGDFAFMSTLEKKMIDEINLMRSNPKAYIEYLEEYVEEEKKVMIGVNPDFDVAVEELKSELRSMDVLSVLKPHQKLFEVTKAHGIDNKDHNQIEHTGSDGRTSFQRVIDSGLKNSITWSNGSGSYAPNENLATGTQDITVRQTVMMLLIDAGISTRGHRKALIEPTWEYVACYHIDMITKLKDYVDAGMENTDAPNCWVQMFAKGPDDNTSDTASAQGEESKNTEVAVESGTKTEIDDNRPTRSKPATETSGTDEKSKSSEAVAASGDFSFMSTLEKSMIDEINLMRADPAAYIKHVDAYVKKEREMMIGVGSDYDATVNELKSQLRAAGTLSILKPHQKLFEVTKAHGIDNKNHNQIEHTGSDGRSSFQRVKDSGLKNSVTWKNGSGNYAPNENLATGTEDITVREIVMMLLIDYGIQSRGHRKALIEPSWEYVACYHIDMIKNLKDYVDAGMEETDAPNCWVQMFAKGPDDNSGASSTQASNPTTNPLAEKEEEVTTVSKPDPSTTAITETASKPNTEETNTNPSEETKASSEANTAASGDFSFMSTLEKSMIDEINLMRADPAGYIKHVDAYVKKEKEMMIGVGGDYDATVNELKAQLRAAGKLSILKPHKKLYGVAKAHGIDNKNHNQIEHTGSDGRSSFQRVKDSGLKNSVTWENGSGNYAPNENLATGTDDITVREIVMMLLIDYGIPTRGHRKALIEPSWEYVACYHIDMIKNLKDYVDAGMAETDALNCWVQVFAID